MDSKNILLNKYIQDTESTYNKDFIERDLEYVTFYSWTTLW